MGCIQISALNATSGQHTLPYFNILDIGGGICGRAYKFYPGNHIVTLDIKTGFDVERNDLPSGNWDILFVNHFIEHIVDVDGFLKKCKSVMSEKTILEIATPNLLSWYNRLFCLAGYLPNNYEVSKYNVGRCLCKSEPTGGHIHVFTPRALTELLVKYGFRIMLINGERSTYNCNPVIRAIDGILTRNVHLASAFRIKCTL